MDAVEPSITAAIASAMPYGLLIWKLDEDGSSDVVPAVDPSRPEPRSLAPIRLQAANATASTMCRLPLDTMIGRTMPEIFPTLSRETLAAYVEIACSGESRDLSVAPCEDGIGPTYLRVRAIGLPGRRVAALFDDVTEQTHADAELRKVNAFLDSVVENIPTMVFVKRADSLRFERVNRAAEELIGLSREALIGKADSDFFPPDQAAFFEAKDRATLAGGTVIDIPEEPLETATGPRWLHTRKIPILDEAGVPRYLLGISEDITEMRRAHEELERRVEARTEQLRLANAELEREIAEHERTEEALRRSEEQLQHALKMEAVGRLAGGIAHDFNNMLSVILSHTALLSSELASSDPMRDDLEQVKDAAERATRLTKQLLAFSRQQVLQPRSLDVNEVLTGMDNLLRRLIGEDIELAYRLKGDLGLVHADPGQVEQVVMNLVVNARDAMPEGGKLTLETANVTFGESDANPELDVGPGPYVMLAVSDTGHGMDAATKLRVFEPFFTTKELGKGTGLGLSTVYGIVRQSGGTIWVYSEQNIGTSFKIYLPRLTGAALESSARSVMPDARGGSETILLVEDEYLVRAAARRILKKKGYSLLEARSGDEALALCETHIDKIDLMITDVVMPGLSGPELAKRLAERRPEVRVLYMSGYTDNAVIHRGVSGAGMAFLQKPFTPDALASKVRQVLDAASAVSPPPPTTT